MNNHESEGSASFTHALACAALGDGLRAILILDSAPRQLIQVAVLLQRMLSAVTGQEVKQVILGSAESDDDLWHRVELRKKDGEPRFVIGPGPLIGGGGMLPLVVIPDLARFGLAGARACVMLAGADVAYLDRHGQHIEWPVRMCWLAGCATADIGKVSPHLLDRFAVRLRDPGLTNEGDMVPDISRWLAHGTEDRLGRPILDLKLERRLTAARHSQRPHVLPTAVDRVLDYPGGGGIQGSRRDLALARLAVAHAELTGATDVTPIDVDAAAEMMGLASLRAAPRKESPVQVPVPVQSPKESPSSPKASLHAPSPALTQVERVTETVETDNSVVEREVMAAGEPRLLTAASVAFVCTESSYPEDTAEVDRDEDSLRLLSPRYGMAGVRRGPVLGTMPATSRQDIAVIATLLEAAKFQFSRRKRMGNAVGPQPLIIERRDLRAYRRAPIAEQMMALVLDHTSLRDWDWRSAVAPYVQWAYVERASVCVVHVGWRQARSALRAERIRARNPLDPRIRVLRSDPGRATPLAHGLDLVTQTLQQAMQRGAGTIRHAWLVVVTDGRGNVPLKASQRGLVEEPVGREGVDDALQVASQIRSMHGIDAIVIDPGQMPYPELPFSLAKALGGTLVAGRAPDDEKARHAG
jgi:magnesium chelatase subunit D